MAAVTPHSRSLLSIIHFKLHAKNRVNCKSKKQGSSQYCLCVLCIILIFLPLILFFVCSSCCIHDQERQVNKETGHRRLRARFARRFHYIDPLGGLAKGESRCLSLPGMLRLLAGRPCCCRAEWENIHQVIYVRLELLFYFLYFFRVHFFLEKIKLVTLLLGMGGKGGGMGTGFRH